MMTEALIKKALSTSPAQIGHYIESGYMNPAIMPVSDDFCILGPAFTVRCPTNDNSIIYYAMKRAPKGSVLVIDRMGEKRFAAVGEIVALSAKSLGLAGIIVDGPSTDTKALREIGLPVFSTGRSAVTNSIIGLNGEFNIPVNCGGAVVCPGDIVYGDLDGVIVCPADAFEKNVDIACKDDEEEVEMRLQIKDGKTLCDIWNIDRAVEADTKSLLNQLL